MVPHNVRGQGGNVNGHKNSWPTVDRVDVFDTFLESIVIGYALPSLLSWFVCSMQYSVNWAVVCVHAYVLLRWYLLGLWSAVGYGRVC